MSVGIDELLLFQPLKFGLLTIAEPRDFENETSGNGLEENLKLAGHVLQERKSVKNEVVAISNQVKTWSQTDDIDVIVTTGGTGFLGSDFTFDAIEPLFEKTIDGFAILFHRLKTQADMTGTLHSRVNAGLVHHTLVFCLPKPVELVNQVWDAMLREALDSRYRPSSLVDLLPRLNE